MIAVIAAAGCGDSEQAKDPGTNQTDRRLERIDAARDRAKQRLRKLRRELRKQERSGGQEGSGRPGGGGAQDGGANPLAGLDQLEAELGAELGASAGPAGGGTVHAGGSLRSGSAWSTIKVPIALRVIEDAGGPGGLTATQRSLIERALTASDNEAAATLFGELGKRYGGVGGAAGAVTEVLREAGDTTTEVSTVGRDGFSPYGQTEWSLESQHRFMTALAARRIGPAAGDDLVLELMGRVSSDRWGLGSIGLPARWKGGWGPGTDGRYLLRQMGLVELGGETWVVTLIVRPGDGSFATGQTVADRLAAWIAERIGT